VRQDREVARRRDCSQIPRRLESVRPGSREGWSMHENIEDEIDWLNEQKREIEAELSGLADSEDVDRAVRLSRAREAYELLIALVESKRLRRQSHAA
jgi:hypothetical protein